VSVCRCNVVNLSDAFRTDVGILVFVLSFQDCRKNMTFEETEDHFDQQVPNQELQLQLLVAR
jgi:hypothetical protein